MRISILHVRRQRGCVRKALDMIGQSSRDVSQLITHRFPFAETPAAFDLVANYRDGVIKAIIELPSP